eukprot:330966_1
MYHKWELSKSMIKNNKWQPHVGEKIRLIEIKYKPPYRSYPASIKKILQTKIYVCYDGYDDDQGEWVKKDQWIGRITILGNKGGNDSGVFVRYGKKDSRGQKGKAYKWKHIDEWTSKELQEWINSLKLNNSSKKTVLENIVEQEITGADVNSLGEVSDIKDSFEITKGPATIIFRALLQARSKSIHDDDDEEYEYYEEEEEEYEDGKTNNNRKHNVNKSIHHDDEDLLKQLALARADARQQRREKKDLRAASNHGVKKKNSEG